MMLAILLGLGMVVCINPGLGGHASPFRSATPVPRHAGSNFPQLDTTTTPTVPSSPTREALFEVDSEEEDESVHLNGWSASSTLGKVAGDHRLIHRAATSPSDTGLLHELHRSWQLLC